MAANKGHRPRLIVHGQHRLDDEVDWVSSIKFRETLFPGRNIITLISSNLKCGSSTICFCFNSFEVCEICRISVLSERMMVEKHFFAMYVDENFAYAVVPVSAVLLSDNITGTEYV